MVFFCSTSTVTRRASLVPDLKNINWVNGTEVFQKMIEIDCKVHFERGMAKYLELCSSK